MTSPPKNRTNQKYGSFEGNDGKTATYTLNMAYDNMHNIISKKQDMTQSNLQFAGSLYAGYDLKYDYAENSQQIRNIADSSYRRADNDSIAPVIVKRNYGYDANGNLTYIATGKQLNGDSTTLQATGIRKLLWDEENRLLAINDNGFVSNYWYDADGERAVKMSAENEGVYVNGVQAAGKMSNAKFTAYINPYMVVNSGGWYSKHIYMGSQRIASKMGNSGMFTDRNPLTDTTAYKRNYTPKLESLTKGIKTRYDSLGVEYPGTPSTAGLVNSSPGNTTQSYFYHSDHLGSSSVITDHLGGLVQHVEYVPFGEVFVEERASASSWRTPYLFNAKELDDETGLYYYGARYYDPRTSVWLSVDPLAEENPNISSYAYCEDNPINRIDPDGRQSTATLPYKAYRAYRAARAAGAAYGGFVLGKYGLEYLTKQQMEQKGREVANDLIQRAETNETSTQQAKSETNQEKNTNPKREAREKGKEKREEQPESEQRTKQKAKELEKVRGKDARREGHDQKKSGEPDRNRRQVNEDYDPNNYKPKWERTDRGKS